MARVLAISMLALVSVMVVSIGNTIDLTICRVSDLMPGELDHSSGGNELGFWVRLIAVFLNLN